MLSTYNVQEIGDMRWIVAVLCIGTVGYAGPAPAQSLPTGTYAITGTVTSMSGKGCPLAAKLPISGAIVYPGIGNDEVNLVISLETVKPNSEVSLVALSAFPPVPQGGLDGWTQSSPVSPDYAQYRNGKLIEDDVGAALYFNLAQTFDGQLASAQGTMTLSVDFCTETILATFLRTAVLLKK